jgi:hypothetical protein
MEVVYTPEAVEDGFAGIARHHHPIPKARGVGMDRLREFLDSIRTQGVDRGSFLGLLHVLIGRRVTLEDGTVVSAGMTWRELAALLKKVRWDRESVNELGLDPANLPPRDRQRFWYAAISQASVYSTTAVAAGDRLAEAVKPLGYVVGPPPGAK